MRNRNGRPRVYVSVETLLTVCLVLMIPALLTFLRASD